MKRTVITTLIVAIALGAWSYGLLTIANQRNTYNPYDLTLMQMQLDAIANRVAIIEHARPQIAPIVLPAAPQPEARELPLDFARTEEMKRLEARISNIELERSAQRVYGR